VERLHFGQQSRRINGRRRSNVVPRLRPGNSAHGNFSLEFLYFNVLKWLARFPTRKRRPTPAQVRTEETAEAPKLVEESEEDSPDDAELPGAILHRQASVSSLTISCGDSSEHEGPDSGKLLFQFSL
jgi:hypothetical protein